jgi:uncharacterized protein
MLNALAGLAIVLAKRPAVDRSPQPGDNELVATAQAAEADDLVTGDREELRTLKRPGRTPIARARRFLKALGRERP